MKNPLSVITMVLLAIVGTEGAGHKWTRGGKRGEMKTGDGIITSTTRMTQGGKMLTVPTVQHDIKQGNGAVRQVQASCSSSSCDRQLTTTSMTTTRSKCGGAVNAGAQNCGPMLWTPTQNTTMPCFAYGGPSDPCALNINNDLNHGMNKDPSNCESQDKTFFLWDEPDTQGRDYIWAGGEWLKYSIKFSQQIMDMRNNQQFKFTSPLIRADQPSIDIANFYAGCNPNGLNMNPCEDPTNPAYINIIAVNAYYGPWNNNNQQPTEVNCREGAAFVIQNGPYSLNKIPQVSSNKNKLPVYVTNWARKNYGNPLQSPDAQLVALDATDAWFAPGSPVQVVYWFGATDYESLSMTGKVLVNDIGNMLTNKTTTTLSLSGQKTLGQLWNEKCKTLV